MRWVVIGAHLAAADVEPLADALPMRDLVLSALAVAPDQPLGDRDLLLRVATIRAQLLERATFIAVRYGFAVWSAAEAESKCGVHVPRWRALLEANLDHVEMTLKAAAATTQSRPDRKEFTSGAAYLKALHATSAASAVDPRFRDAVEHSLAPLTVQHRWLHRDNRSLEFAMLVRRERLDEVRAAGESLRATRVPFMLSGPWPLEVFADE